jgi:DNA (cytosine-5)-methyltransferase 1
MHSALRVGTVCSGIESPIQALNDMGISYTHEYACEKDDKCVHVITQKFNPPRLYRDLWEMSDHDDLPEVDVLVAGLPCQAFASIGHRKGFDDERGRLYVPLLKIMEKTKPKYVLFENVTGILNHDKGQTFRTIMEEFVKAGYSYKKEICKSYNYGVPQNRRRVYVVCYRTDDPDGAAYQYPSPIPLKKSLSDILGGHVDRKIGFTVRVGGRNSPIDDRHNWDGYRVDGIEKRLTVGQACELQGFPADFYSGISQSEDAFISQMGNAMTVPVVGAVMGNLLFDGVKLVEKYAGCDIEV